MPKIKRKHRNWVDAVYGDEKRGKVFVVVGGQYGSEAKGLFASYLAKKENVDYAVRTGSINAGHTVFYKGKAYKNQQIPVAWINPHTRLVIGAGAYVSPGVLEREIKMIEEATGQSIKDRLFIDGRCGSQLPIHAEREAGLHERMGSTGEGVSEAIKDKMDRKFDYARFAGTPYAMRYKGKSYQEEDTVRALNRAYDEGGTILVEGTQGALLDLHLSYYPFCTSRQTIAASWLAEAGLSPNMNLEIAMICRTFPIRVAGNSGPMPNEVGWTDLLRSMNGARLNRGLAPLVEEKYLI